MKRNLQEYREQASMTQELLAQKVGVATITIRKYESSDRNPSIKVAKKICGIFDKKLEEIFPDIYSLD